MNYNILVTVVGGPSGAGVVKSLLKFREFKLFVTDLNEYASGFYYNNVKPFIVPNAEQQKYVEHIMEICEKEKIDVILPCNDKEVVALSRSLNTVRKNGVRILIPDFKTTMNAHDKYNVMQTAAKIGIPHPKTFLVDDMNDLDTIDLDYPIIIKPRTAKGGRGIRRVNNLEELMRNYSEIANEYGKPMVQEFIPGEQGSIYLFAGLYDNDHQLKASIVCRGLRSRPPTGGPAIVGETIENEEIRNHGIKIMENIGKWVGPVNMEFKLDTRDGVPKLLEINPRLWGYNYLATIAGINFPYLIIKIALGENVREMNTYKTGKVFIRRFEDYVYERDEIVRILS